MAAFSILTPVRSMWWVRPLSLLNPSFQLSFSFTVYTKFSSLYAKLLIIVFVNVLHSTLRTVEHHVDRSLAWRHSSTSDNMQHPIASHGSFVWVSMPTILHRAVRPPP